MNRGAPLQRKSPLKRKAWMKRARTQKAAVARLARGPRKRTKYAARKRDWDWMSDVRSMPCCARELGGCAGEITVDHVGKRGMGRKSDDREVVSHCERHHETREHFYGVLKTWKQADMRAYMAEALRVTVARVLELRAARERRAAIAAAR